MNEGQTNSVTSAMVVDGTIVRADVASSFKAPYSDTADYARVAPAVDSARVAANSHKLQGKDTIALSTKFVDEGQANAITSAMITDGAITSADIRDTTLTTAKIKDNALTSAKIQDGTIVRADVASSFKAPYSDTADYARVAPAVDSARVAGNAHKLQNKDTIALSTKFVDEGQASSITSTMIVDGTIATADIASNAITSAKIGNGEVTMPKINQSGATLNQVIKWNGTQWAPANDSFGGPPSGPAGGDLTGNYPNPTIANNAVNSAKIQDGTVTSADIRDTTITTAKIKDGAVTSAKIVDGTIATADLANNAITSAKIADTNVTMAKIQRAGAATGQVLKWTGSAWAPSNDSIGQGENAWVRGTPDSVLFTIHQLGIARGGSNNMLYGNNRSTHTNLGVACTTGTEGENLNSCTVGGGYGNTATSNYATVGGGSQNTASHLCATVSGGEHNTASGNYATAGGGYADTTKALYGGILSGYSNLAGDAEADTGAAVVGGYNNSATEKYAFVGGGQFNRAHANFATVTGGYGDTASGTYAFVGGGYRNKATQYFATVVNGDYNKAINAHATVVGGSNNTASGNYATVPGGFYNAARGYGSFAAGRYARANHRGSFVWSDSATGSSESVYTAAANQFRARARGGTWFFSNGAMTSGVYLAPNANSWTGISFDDGKEKFQEVDHKELLNAISKLRVRYYQIKEQEGGIRHIGPLAKEFYDAFGVGEGENGINMADADGVLFAAVQALYQELQQERINNKELRQELEVLKAQLQKGR